MRIRISTEGNNSFIITPVDFHLTDVRGIKVYIKNLNGGYIDGDKAIIPILNADVLELYHKTVILFENRFRFVPELVRMGAKITVEGKSAIIKGTRKLYGANVKATDLRGGASLVLASLFAKGKTEIDDIKYILRGYEKFDEKELKEIVKDQVGEI